MNKYKVIMETYVEAEDVLGAMWKGWHKLNPLQDTQFQFEVIDVHEFTENGWESSSGIVEIVERFMS